MMKQSLQDSDSPVKISPRALEDRSRKPHQHRYERRKIKQYYRLHWDEEAESETLGA